MGACNTKSNAIEGESPPKKTSGQKDDGEEDWHMVNQYKMYNKDIGVGAYGHVRKAVDTNTNVTYAVKIFNMEQLNRRKSISRRATSTALNLVEKEIAVMKKLEHPSCLKLIEVIQDDEEHTLCMVLEYADGGTVMGDEPLQDPIPESKAREIFQQVVSGIDYLHSQLIMHRDIKPENLLWVGGKVKLADYGTASFISADDPKSEETEIVQGTAAFMAPEMCSDDSHHVYSMRKHDIWALGVTLYQMVYGVLPFYR